MSQSLARWLEDAPYGLAMSSGYFSFYAHCGVLAALEHTGLVPARLSGSSAGALVTGGWAAGVSADELRDELLSLARGDFWDPRPGVGLLAGRKFRQRLEHLLPVSSFEHCRAPLAVSVFELFSRRTRVLSRGPLAPALHASCALPVLFHPVRHQQRLLIDGGVADRPGLAGMPAGQRTLFHHIVSRSPWRRRAGGAMRLPQRDRMVTIAIDGLPRSGPFSLDVGRRALALAYQSARRLLDRPVAPVMRISAC